MKPTFPASLLEKVWDELEGTHQVVLRDYFGLFERPAKTLEEIGKNLGVTRQRVGQFKEAAILKAIPLLREKGLLEEDGHGGTESGAEGGAES